MDPDTDLATPNEAGGLSFGLLLRRYRLAANLSQEGLAERARLSVETVSALERGVRRAPHRDTLALLAKALQLSDQDYGILEKAASAPPRVRRAAAHGVVVALSPLQAPSHNLPVEVSSLIGRADVIAQVAQMLQNGRLVTLVGSGGIGKTRIALRVAANDVPRWPDGVWIAELAPIRNAALVTGAVARILAIEETPQRPLLDSLIESLKQRRTLIVLDNCDHVIDEVRDLVAVVLRTCPTVKMLATSREPLHLAGEQILRVPSLEFPEHAPLTAKAIESYSAVALFAERARAADAGFTTGDANAGSVADICRRLDGIPLAIELAAARANVLTPRELLNTLDERFRVLTDADRTAAPRQRTMWATIDWSYKLLSSQEQHLFDRLSVFAGSCALKTITTICSDAEIEPSSIRDVVWALADKSLVVAERSAEETRYRLLESSREYARERLVERGELDSVARKHAQAYVALCKDLLASSEASDWLPMSLGDQLNWTSALTWSLAERNDVALGQSLATYGAWAGSGEPSRWVRLALASIDAGTPPSTVAALKTRLAHYLATLSPEAALQMAEQAARTYMSLGDHPGAARANRLAARALGYLGRAEEAISLAEAAVATLRECDDRAALGTSLHTLSTLYLAQGEDHKARSALEEALTMYDPGGFLSAIVEMDLAEIEAGQGKAAVALSYSQHALPILRAVGHPHLALNLSNTAAYLIALERYDEARHCALESLAIMRSRASSHGFGTVSQVQRLATIAILDSEQARYQPYQEVAARLLGYVDSHLSAVYGTFRWPAEQLDFDRALKRLRQDMADEAVAALMQAGTTLTETEAIEWAISLTHIRPVLA